MHAQSDSHYGGKLPLISTSSGIADDFESTWRQRNRDQLIAFASLIPAFALVIAVVWYPVVQTLYYSFTDWNGAKANWVGLDNYEQLIRSDDFWVPLRTNLIMLLSVPGILVISLVVAALIFERLRGWTVFRSVYYIPTILSAAVVGMLMRVMFTSRGAVNDMLERIGLEQFQQDWLGSTRTAFMVLIFVFYWQTLGQGVLIFLAGLASIPGDLIEAAELDGATWFQRLRQIVVPQLTPAIAYFVIINAVWVFVGLFALVFTVTDGGPGYSTTPLDLMIYRKAFEFGQMGYASAMSLMLFGIVSVISIIQLRFFDRRTER
jgi:raffinose/stachyose/melibiose transport system permease protein